MLLRLATKRFVDGD